MRLPPQCPEACRAAQADSSLHAIDEFLRFSVQEEIRGGRPRRYGVYRNRPPAQFLRKDCRESFDGGLSSGVDAVGLELESDNTRGEVDDASAIANPLGCFA